MNVLALQLDIAWEDKPANHRKVRAMVDAARPAPGTLVVLPEMFSTGFSMNVPAISDTPTHADHTLLTTLAKERDLWLLAGTVTTTPEGKGRNQALLISPLGREVARYTKLHPFSPAGESLHYLPGDAVLLDTRHSDHFVTGFVPGSISIGLDGRFAEWAGSILPFDKPIVLVTSPGEEKESVVRLARVGFDKVKGYLAGGFEAWRQAGEPIDMIIDVEPDELAMDIPFDENLIVLDVRRETEFADGHVKDALNIPLQELADPGNMAQIEERHNLYVHCGGGYRSIIAASLLKRQGIHNLRNVNGGWGKIKDQKGIEIIKEKSVLN